MKFLLSRLISVEQDYSALYLIFNSRSFACHNYTVVYLQRSDVQARDRHGNTALHLAAQYGHSWLCVELVTRGGCHMLSLPNNDGRTPFDTARLGRQVNG
jgi:ankyrin repeat protein